LNSVSVPSENLAINVSGTVGDFGHIQIYCGSRGNVYDTGGLITSHGNQTLTGTYTFNDTSMLFSLRWFGGTGNGDSGNGNGNGPQPTNLLAQVLLSFPTLVQSGTNVNGTLNVTGTGYPTIYLWSISLNEPYTNWTVNIAGLPM